ncbi:hypothetical protein L6272_03925, partial [Microgenomates group bacterium]|nr:hypothetical protein [Microgenomates group bacterium]
MVIYDEKRLCYHFTDINHWHYPDFKLDFEISGCVRAKATAELEASQQVDKSIAAPGETLSYTFIIGNNGDEILHDVLVAEHFSDFVDYQPGSTQAQKDGAGTVTIDDNWISSHVNLGTLDPSQQARLTFRVIIKGSTPLGSTVETTSQVKSNELTSWLQRAAQTQVAADTGNTQFDGGDSFLAVNNTNAESNWHDPVSAVVGNVIEFKFRIVNSGESETRNTKVRVQLAWDPQNLSTTLSNSATVTADNAAA